MLLLARFPPNWRRYCFIRTVLPSHPLCYPVTVHPAVTRVQSLAVKRERRHLATRRRSVRQGEMIPLLLQTSYTPSQSVTCLRFHSSRSRQLGVEYRQNAPPTSWESNDRVSYILHYVKRHVQPRILTTL